jgi:hypothetical protein
VKQFIAFGNVPEICLKEFRHVSRQKADILNN